MYVRSLIRALNIKYIFYINSFFWKYLLRLNGIKVGKKFYIEGSVSLKINGFQKVPIIFSDNVSILGDIDLRTREMGEILIEDNVNFDNNVRIVAAQNGKITIGKNTRIGCYSIFNGGADITIESNCLIGSNCNINSSDHKIQGKKDFLKLGYRHSPIKICKGSWMGTNVVILPGINIGKGVVVGASSVVTKNIPEYSVSAGIPSKVIKKRL